MISWYRFWSGRALASFLPIGNTILIPGFGLWFYLLLTPFELAEKGVWNDFWGARLLPDRTLNGLKSFYNFLSLEKGGVINLHLMPRHSYSSTCLFSCVPKLCLTSTLYCLSLYAYSPLLPLYLNNLYSFPRLSSTPLSCLFPFLVPSSCLVYWLVYHDILFLPYCVYLILLSCCLHVFPVVYPKHMIYYSLHYYYMCCLCGIQ